MRFKSDDILSDRYRIVEQIGNGAFGEVYEAYSERFGQVAIKILPGELSPKQADLVLKEAVILSELEHPNIVKILEVGRHSSNCMICDYLVMEFMAGGTLADYLMRKTRLGVLEACRVGCDMLAALAYAHGLEPPIIHGDIKPANIFMVSEDPLRAKVGDFGLSDRACPITGLASAVGTLYYLAPECFWGYSVPGSDVFSAALVIYQLLTGTAAFSLPDINEQADEKEWCRAIEQSRKHSPPPPSTFNGDIDAQIDLVMLKALALDHRARYASAVEFHEDLEAAIPGPSISHEASSAPADSICEASIPIFGLEEYRLLATSGHLTQDELNALWDLYKDLESPIFVDQGGAFSAVTIIGVTRTELSSLDGHSLSDWLSRPDVLIPELRIIKDIGKLMYSNPYSQRASRCGKLLYAAAIAQGMEKYGERISALSVSQLRILFDDLLAWSFLPPKFRTLLTQARALV